jgi:DNA-binding NtrC family response regulator
MSDVRKPRILVVDDEEEIRDSLDLLLRSEGFAVDTVEDGEAALGTLAAESYDVVLLDLMLPGRSGIEIQKDIRALDPAIPVIVITAMAVIETAVTAVRGGAFDYVTKPWSNEKLIVSVTNAVRQRKLQTENQQLRRALDERSGSGHIVGKSERTRRLLDLVAQVAPSRSTVLIQGESGTGKELVARAIHRGSPRADKPFIPVNSGSLPVDLLESTLFGHVKGAFTSAVAAKKGLFEVAEGGTIFFDEIGTIGPETQAKLLRVIQEREFMRLGGTETIRVDTRVIAATNVDLRELVQTGAFREDLFYRLNVITIDVPPLRERRDDVPLLVEFFLKRYTRENGKPECRFSPDALKLLLDAPWPGNVRELENVVERAVVLASGNLLGRDLLPEAILDPPSDLRTLSTLDIGKESSLSDIMDTFERRVLLERLERFGWSQTAAAESFSVPLSTLNQKLKRLGIRTTRRKREKSSA